MLSKAEMARRRSVWLALSALWLDTEFTEEGIHYIAKVLHASGYSVTELRSIYLNEVAPVVYMNALSVAGAWAGFDPDWLSEQAAKRANKGATTWDSRWNVKRRIMTYATEHHWKRLEQLLS